MKRKPKRYSIDLPAHMAECDANYLCIMKLFPSLRENDVSLFGVMIADEAAEVSIEVLERNPYTTSIKLTQLPEAPWGANPTRSSAPPSSLD